MMIIMSATRQRRSSTFLNIVTATSGVGILVACLLTIDARVREQVSQIITGAGTATEIGTAAFQVQNRAGAILDIIQDQNVDVSELLLKLVHLVSSERRD